MTQIQIRYFAAAAEAAGVQEETLPSPGTLAQLRSTLSQKYGEQMSAVMRSGSFLVNGIVRRDQGELTDSPDQPVTVDVLPPFAGG